MTSWLAPWDETAAGRGARLPRLVEKGTLVIDLMLPLCGPAVLLGYAEETDWPRAFSVLADPAEGIGVMHRQGQTLLRHMLPGALTGLTGPARLLFSWDAPARRWDMVLEQIEGMPARRAEGEMALPIPIEDVRALCAESEATEHHPAVRWVGVTAGAPPSSEGCSVGLGTVIATPNGPIRAASLRAGDLVMTRDGGAMPLLSIHQTELPTRGHFSPLRLRAPFFGATADVIVSPRQRLVLGGPDVEYLFGEDEVVVEARALVDGRLAVTETRRPYIGVLSLNVGRQEVLLGNGCALTSGDMARGPDVTARWRDLQRYEAMALRSLRAGLANRDAA